MNNMIGQELRKFVKGDAETIEKYLKSESPSRKKTRIQMEGSVEGVADVLFTLDISDQIDIKTVKVAVNKEVDRAVASCVAYAPADCPE